MQTLNNINGHINTYFKANHDLTNIMRPALSLMAPLTIPVSGSIALSLYEVKTLQKSDMEK
jgi:hypothetical protein